MENLIFEILKMAGFIVVLFLCCLWLVKDKRSFYKFRDWGLDSTDCPGRICNLLHRLLGSWDERIADNLGGPFFFCSHVSHDFSCIRIYSKSGIICIQTRLICSPFSIIHFAAFLVSFLVVLQLFGKQFLSWLKLKLSNPERQYIFFDLNEGAVALAEDLLKKDRKRLFFLSIRM